MVAEEVVVAVVVVVVVVVAVAVAVAVAVRDNSVVLNRGELDADYRPAGSSS